MQTKRIAIAALLLAVALIIGIIENLIPPIIPMLPYIKIGLSNMVIIVAILLLDAKYAFTIIGIKSVLVPLFIGNPIMIFYSLPSALIAVAITALCLNTKKISIPATSILSAIIHNFIQVSVAAIMTNFLVFGYLPYFIVIGAIAGLVTGIFSFVIIKYIPQKNIIN